MNFAAELLKASVNRTIRDLGHGDMTLFRAAADEIQRRSFMYDMLAVGYPVELLDTLNEVVRRSKAERKVLVREILSELKFLGQKKVPGEPGTEPRGNTVATANSNR